MEGHRQAHANKIEEALAGVNRKDNQWSQGSAPGHGGKQS